MIPFFMSLFALALIALGTYLIKNRHQPFLIYDPRKDLKLQSFMTQMAISFYLTAICAIITIFLPVTFQIIILVIGSILTGYLAVAMTKFAPK